MRVIFLDIDGVLNHSACHEAGRALIDPDCVGRLNAIVRRTGAVLVISSNWRGLVHEGVMTLDGFRWLLRSHGLEAKIVDVTCPDDDEPLRGAQIRRWLAEHPEVEGILVLDDAPVSLGELARHVLYTNDTCGLADEDVEKAVEILSWPIR